MTNLSAGADTFLEDRLHHEFGQDIETLYQNLNNLVSVINLAQKGRLPTSRPSSATTVCLNQILGNFEDTLRDCLQLLESNQSYGERKGPIYNISWYLRVKDEVDQLRDRIAFLNIKVRSSTNRDDRGFEKLNYM